MLFDQISNILCSLVLHYLNIVLYATSDNYIFIEAERLLHELSRHDASIVSLLLIPILTEVIKAFIHYFLGHVMAIVVILEAEALHNHAANWKQACDDEPSIPVPISRGIFSACIFLVRTAGLRVFFKGIRAAIVYRVSFLLLTLFIEKTERLILGPQSFVPFIARFLSTVFLSNLHLAWTQATISLPSPSPASSLGRPSSWRVLAPPSLFFAIVQTLMDLLPRVLIRGLVFLVPEAEHNASSSSSSSPWRAKLTSQILITACRLILHFPALVALTLVEIRLLPDGENTIVPSVRGRGARVGELGAFGAADPYARPDSDFMLGAGADEDPGLETLLGLDLVRWSTILWLCELHVKNCLVQFVVDVLMGR